MVINVPVFEHKKIFFTLSRPTNLASCENKGQSLFSTWVKGQRSFKLFPVLSAVTVSLSTHACAKSQHVLSSIPVKVAQGVEKVIPNGVVVSLKHNVDKAIDRIASQIEKVNMDLDSEIVTLSDIQEAYTYLHEKKVIVRTPTLKHVQDLFINAGRALKENGRSESEISSVPEIPDSVDLYLKMENMQITGSFKIRGCANQMRKIQSENGDKIKLVTFSAGNYGKAFAYCVQDSDVEAATCIMPDSVPLNRVSLLQGFGVDVKLAPYSELTSEVNKFVSNGYRLCHSFNDIDLIAGNASAGLELLEEVPDPDIILVCCGGGGLVSGVSAAVSLSGVKNCRVYAVEPEGAPKMFESFKQRRAVTLPHVQSVAKGLCPPYAGSICYKHCRWFVEDVLLVSEEEIISAMQILFYRGIKVEASGAAAMAALLFNKVPDVAGKKVVVILTGGNVSSSELTTLIPDVSSS